MEDFDIYQVVDIQELYENQVSFEVAYACLENIVKQQDQQSLSLDQMLHYYKLGKILSGYCNQVLEKAKLEIEILDQQAVDKVNEND